MFSGEFKYTSDLDLSFLKENFYSQCKKMDALEGKDLVILFGSSKSGKSTFANYMAGCQMEKQEKFGSLVIVPKTEHSEYVKIGHGFFSETSYPQTIPTKHGFEFCDSPSFDDNRLIDAKVCGSLLTQLAIKKSKKVNGVVILLPYVCFNNIDYFYHTAKAANQLLGCVSEIKESVIFLITKAPPDVTMDHVMEKIKKYSELENKTNKKIATKLDQFLTKNPSKIHLFKPLDETQRTLILNQVKDLKAIPKTQFKPPKYDVDHAKLERMILDIARIGVELFEFRNELKKLSGDTEEIRAIITAQLEEVENTIKKSFEEKMSDMRFAYNVLQFMRIDSELAQLFVKLFDEYKDNLENVKKPQPRFFNKTIIINSSPGLENSLQTLKIETS